LKAVPNEDFACRPPGGDEHGGQQNVHDEGRIEPFSDSDGIVHANGKCEVPPGAVPQDAVQKADKRNQRADQREQPEVRRPQGVKNPTAAEKS
jgi:hypothetical protein